MEFLTFICSATLNACQSNTAAAGILVAQGSTVGLDAVEFSSNVVQVRDWLQ